MSLKLIPPARTFNRFLASPISKRTIDYGKTSGLVEEELWSSLEYYSEVNSVGKQFLIKRGVSEKDLDSTYDYFRAVVRQGKSFYRAAAELDHRSSSLLYYYSFLNLAKAALVISDPKIKSMKLNHGLASTSITSSKPFKEETLRAYVAGKNVFPLLYKDYFNETPKVKYYNISHLMSYCTDISVQYALVNSSPPRLIPAYYCTVFLDSPATAWGLLAIMNNSEIASYSKRFNKFNQTYQEVLVNVDLAKELFGLNPFAHSHYRYFQQLNPVTSEQMPLQFGDEISKKILLDSLPGLMQSNYFDSELSLYISLPYRKHLQSSMDEIIAIYIIFNYLGNLVRYKPQNLERFLNSEESWLIENFVRFCPETFLRGMISHIIDHDIIYLRR